MLVDTNLDGQILHAEGAFHACFGDETETFIGRQVTDLLAPADSAAFPFTLAQILSQELFGSHMVELSNLRQSRMVMSGIQMPEDPPRLRLLFSTTPIELVTFEAASHLADLSDKVCSAALHQPDNFVVLFELGNRQEDSTPHGMAETLLLESMQNENATTISASRFALIMPNRKAAMQLRAQILTKLHPYSQIVQLSTGILPLQEAGLIAPQVARTLYFALNQFAIGGMKRMQQMGFDSGLSGFVDHAAVHAQTLRTIIHHGHFTLALEPIVRMADRKPLYHEALLRLPDTLPELLRSSFTFVTLAATVGLGEDMDYAVLDSAMKHLAQQPEARLAINVSAHSLQSVAFRTRILKRLDQAPGLLNRLIIEITEAVAINDLPTVHKTIAALATRNIAVCLDDFSLEQANVDFLRNADLTYVKVDAPYVRAAENPYGQHILESIFKTATEAGATPIVKRLETPGQIETARAFGYDYGQGWAFKGA